MRMIYIYLQKKIMKQILLLMILPLPLYVFAQDALDTERQPYHPMLKEGKEWRERADHIVYTYSYNEVCQAIIGLIPNVEILSPPGLIKRIKAKIKELKTTFGI